MPLTPNGKVDRKLLEQMAQSDELEEAREFVAPSTETEALLAGIWERVLQREAVSVNDHFFDLGGHSLLAIQVLNRIGKEMGMTIDLKDVFQHATLRDLASYLDKQVAEERRSRRAEIMRLPEQEHYELSPAQTRMYILDKFHAESRVYDVPLVKRIEAEVDVAQFERALQLLIERHDVLRTVFREVDDLPRQKVLEQVAFQLEFHDLSSLATDEQTAMIRALVEAMEERPFDLADGPLLRTILFKRGTDDHIFYLNIHHIVVDGWSLETLFRDLADLYEELPRGASAQRDVGQIRYVEYAAWQNEQLRAGAWQEQEQYWLDVFSKPLPVLDLPTDFQRPEVMMFHGDLLESALSERLTASLRALCKQEGVSLYMALFAAYFLLLHQLTGDEDIIVGTPVDGHDHAELESVVGIFLNTLSLRLRWEGIHSPKQLLQKVKAQFLSAHEHRDYPFDLLIEKLNPERDTSRSPLFSTMFTLLTEESGESAERRLQFRAEEGLLPYKVAKFDLSLLAVDAGERIRLRFEYNSDLFKRETAARFQALFLLAVEAIAAKTSESFARIDLSLPEDRALYERINDTGAIALPTSTIQEAFARQASATPDSPALSDGKSGVLTYADLHERTSRMARLLQDKGVKKGRVVGILMERSRDVVIAMLSVLKAGGAYVPIDPTYPPARIRYMLEDSGAVIVLADEHLRTSVPSGSLLTLCLSEAPAAWSGEEQQETSGPDDPAYLIYTSGSTGLPKGTVVPHRGVVNLAAWTRERYPFAERETWVQFSAHSFDVSVWEIYSALLNGSHLHILSDLERQSVEAFGEAVQRVSATICFLPPAIFHQFACHLPEDIRPFRTLKCIVLAGEALHAESVRQFQARFGTQVEIVNAYGPTEVTVFATSYHLRELVDPNWTTVPIGRPIANTAVHILNQHLQPCPVNVPGELYIEGVGLARGYLNQPERTAEAFLQHPARPEVRIYKTGDTVRLLPSGEIEFIGRRDGQVKVRGHRIEIGEIEACLLQHRSVRATAVVVSEDVAGQTELRAFCTAGGGAVTAEDVRAHLQQQLPAYLIPSQIILLEAMPLLPSGKIDRKALRELVLQRGDERREMVAPTTPIERQIASIWAGIFHREQISVDDHFFDLGGHSLLAIQFLNRVKKELGLTLLMKDVFLNPTLKAMADHLESLSASRSIGRSASIPRLPERAHYPLSHAQKRLWFLYRIDPSSRVYEVPTMVAHQGALDVTIFKTALQCLMDRHESLRTIFFEVDGEPCQRVLSDVVFPFEFRDLSGLDAQEQAEYLDMKLERINARPFDLTTGPLVKSILFKLGAGEFRFYLNIHHIVYDGWSHDLLFGELVDVYTSLQNGHLPALPEQTVRYVDYAAWQDGEMEAHESFWIEELAKPLPVLNLPTDFPRPDVMTFNGAMHQASLSCELAEKLREVAKREDVSMYQLMFAAFVMLLQQLTDEEDLIVGTPVAGRTDQALESVIGFFVNMLAVRTRTRGIATLQELLHRVKDQFLRAYEHQAYSFDRLVLKINPERDASRSPIYSTMFTYKAESNSESSSEKAGALHFESVERDLPHTTAKVDLSLFAMDGVDSLWLAFEYNTDLFLPESIARFSALYQEILHAFVKRLTTPLAHVELLTAEDRSIYAQFNDTVRDYDLDRTIVERFYEAAAADRSKIALSSEHGALTYAELNERSNQVAHLLVSRGIRSGDFVSIILDRSIETVVAMLGVLKAGGVYVPIDAEYPEERIRYMIADSQSPYLLTDRANANRLVDLLVREAGSERQTEILLLEAAIEVPETHDLPVLSTADDLAYVIYTSGSTGQPKGVQIAQRGVLNLVEWGRDRYGFGPDDVMLEFSSYSFDVSVWDTYVGLLLGGRVHLLSKAGRLSAEEFAREVERCKATCVILTVTFFTHLTTYLSEADRAKLSSLRMIQIAGEILPSDAIRKWQRKFGCDLQLVNACGPTETTVYCSAYEIPSELAAGAMNVPVGTPLANYRMYVVNSRNTLSPINVIGEVCIETLAMSTGYLNQPAKTADAFVPNPFQKRFGRFVHEQIYRTGDRGRLLPDGTLEIVGRVDNQVKVRGFRIELGEVEAAMIASPAVQHAVVVVERGPDGSQALHGFYTTQTNEGQPDLRGWLAAKLPAFMVPARLTRLAEMPLSPAGKVDRQALSRLNAAQGAESRLASAADSTGANQTSRQEEIAAIWADVLDCAREAIRLDDNFFDIGGHSLLLMNVQNQLEQKLDVKLPILDLLMHTTVRKLAAALDRTEASAVTSYASAEREASHPAQDDAVAIIGIGLRFPGAVTPYEYWHNLRRGKELIRDVALEDLPFAWEELEEDIRERYVLRDGYLDDIDLFDPDFFQMTHQEASHTDPQQRLFMLTAWEAIENAGYRVSEINSATSVYVGVSDTQYGLQEVGEGAADDFQSELLTNGKFIATRLSYKLNLKGESVVVDSACSTSLTAVHLACQSLLTGQTDYALAGGVSVQTPQKVGYVYEPGFITSPDGHCRAFDQAAGGTVFGNGVGVVLLKRLSDAKRDGDPIYAVIKGSALNNDGNQKIGYTAPSQQGQADVIAKAQHSAGVDPRSITYIEAHGTGTHLGDPIEIAALKAAFGPQEDKRFCAIGSVKSNIGHTDAAAGLAGLIKVALCMKHGELVPSLHYTKPNPACGLEDSPFYVNTEHKRWSRDRGPLRAGVSAFGIGGTNAHVILEEAPRQT
ncbi:amino acid adenylation domain-containing protein [Tumebacillus lipolyticus]